MVALGLILIMLLSVTRITTTYRQMEWWEQIHGVHCSTELGHVDMMAVFMEVTIYFTLPAILEASRGNQKSLSSGEVTPLADGR